MGQMEVRNFHPWDVSPAEAMRIQNQLKSKFVLQDLIHLSNLTKIAGADVSYSKIKNRMYAAVAIFSWPELRVLEQKTASLKATFPYIPGLLAFREGPALTKAFLQITQVPDVVMFDGQGIAHPRGIGIATHVGILLSLPTFGVAKSVLIGDYKEPAAKRGSSTPLVKQGVEIGRALRTKDNVAPVFISVGHKTNLKVAVAIALRSCRGYRLPEPARYAHILSNKLRKEQASPGLK